MNVFSRPTVAAGFGVRFSIRPDVPAMFIALAATMVAVLAIQPFDDSQLGASTSFVPAMLALVACFDLLSAAMLAGRFSDTGSRRLLVLLAGYLMSLAVLLGWGGAFPGVFGSHPPLATSPSNAPWLWVAWHTLFPVILGVGAAPWPRRFETAVGVDGRRSALRKTVIGSCAVGIAIVAGIVWAGGRLPTVIDGVDTTRMTQLAGPVMLPLIAAAAALATIGAMRRGGPERWVAVAVATALGDVVLTLFSSERFSLGWYAGRTMTIVSSGVVLIAILREYSSLRRNLMGSEARQRMLIENMTDGVIMQDGTAEVVAHNPIAARLLGLASDPADGVTRPKRLRRVVRVDGTEWPVAELPNRVALCTGRNQPSQLVGLERTDGSTRWVQVEATAAVDPDGAGTFVVSTLIDVTERAAADALRERARRERIDAIDDVIATGAIGTFFQPIVDLDTSTVIGVEALSRFSGPEGPAVWFAEAASLGMAVELELAALSAALERLQSLDLDLYVSFNVSPATLCSAKLLPLLASHTGRSLVIELTEHEVIAEYDAVLRAIARLREYGIKLAVDDAGAGYSSLRHIVTLRPDIVKVDIALTRGIDDDPARRALATALVGFGEEVGAVIIAEGIETDRELETVRRLGVRVGQGYRLGRPSPDPPSRRAATPAPGSSTGRGDRSSTT